MDVGRPNVVAVLRDPSTGYGVCETDAELAGTANVCINSPESHQRSVRFRVLQYVCKTGKILRQANHICNTQV